MTWNAGLTLASLSEFQSSDTTITAGGSAHTKGSWTQLDASTAFDVTMIAVVFGNSSASGADSSQAFDIGIGAASSEQVLIADIPSGFQDDNLAYFPVRVPAGTRISARVQAVTASDTVDVRMYLYGGSVWPDESSYDAVDTLGMTTSSSTVSTNIESATPVEIIGSTAETYKALGWMFDGGGSNFGGDVSLASIYVGAAASEVALFTNIEVLSSSAEAIYSVAPASGFSFVRSPIPSGSRLSADRSGGRMLGIALFGYR